MSRNRALSMLLLGVLLCPSAALGEEAWPTGSELARELLARSLAPVVAALESASVSTIALRPSTGASSDAELREEIGNFFFDAGYEVFALSEADSSFSGAAVFDFEVDSASLDAARQARGPFGFGAATTLRRASFGFRGRVEEAATGRWIWRGSPRVQIEQWVPASRLTELNADAPAWLRLVPLSASSEGAPWWEKGMVAGLLTGVVMLYFNGTQ